MPTLLIVEDEKLLGRSVASSFQGEGYDAQWVASAEDALTWLRDHQADLAILDCRLPGMGGVELLEKIVAMHPNTIVIMMTAHADVRTAVKAMKLGAADFLIKPIDLDAVSLLVGKNLQHRRLSQTWQHEQKKRSQKYGLHQIIGESPGIEAAKAMVRRLSTIAVAPTDRPPNVLITGETGTGKDVFARAIHYEGPRRGGPFVHVNCAALPESLIESELFGHVMGAFTDARSSKRGLFEVAEQGTLFLDEIGALPMALQSKVLTAIESGKIRPVGGADVIQVNVHLVAAMNQEPLEWVKVGKFREDLYHRLRVIHIHLPTLRQRGADLELLADHFIRHYCRKFSMPAKKLTRPGREAMRHYDWPGNVRELSHCMESAVLLSGETIESDRIPGARNHSPKIRTIGSPNSIPLDFSGGPISLEQVERELIVRAMAETGNNVSRAAQLLFLSRDAMRYRLEKHGLNERRNGSGS